MKKSGENMKIFLSKIIDWIGRFVKYYAFPFFENLGILLSDFFLKKALPFFSKIWNNTKTFFSCMLIPFLKNAGKSIKAFPAGRINSVTNQANSKAGEISSAVNKDFRNIVMLLIKNLDIIFRNCLGYLKKTFVSLSSIAREIFQNPNRQSKSASTEAHSIMNDKVITGNNWWNVLIRNIKYLPVRKLALYCLVFVLLDVFLLWFSSYRILYAKHYWEGVEDKKFFIRPGKSLDEVIGELKQNDILKSKFLFKVYVKLTGKQDKIISKRYIFKSGISNSELLNLLTDRNMVQMEKFTLIEGLRIKQIAKISENKLQLSADRFIQETENDSLIAILGLKGKVKNLEGFLFPDTYYLPLDVDEKGLVNILFNEFRKRVLEDSAVKAGLGAKNKNILEVITLASIVQGETNLKGEMPVVSGVYHNRLKKNIKLEADPTVQYIIPDGPKPRLKYSDLKTESPYNTYLHFGLPPGPINNPGLYAIKASLYPDKNNFLFFVATGNGGHRFTETYNEHLKAVEDYKRNLEKKSEQ